MEKDNIITQSLDAKILKKLIGNDQSRLNVIYIGNIQVGSEEKQLDQRTVHEALYNILRNLEQPRLKNLEKLAKMVALEYNGMSKKQASLWLGKCQSYLSAEFKRNENKEKSGSVELSETAY